MASFPLYDTFFYYFTQKSSLFVQLFRKKWEKNWASTKKLFDTPLKGRGVQAFRFGKNYFELGVGGEGQDTSQHFEGSFGSNLFCLAVTLTLINKPNLKSIRPKLAILCPKILQKITKMAISHFGKMGFWSIFGDIMANLGLIDFKIGLFIKVNVTAWQNKFEVHIYQFAKNGHQLAQIWRMDIKWP